MASGLTIDVDVRAAVDRLNSIGKEINGDALLKVIGQRFLTWINLNFKNAGTEERWAPLSPNTIASRRKGRGTGSPQPLRDTGRLAQSFTSVVSGDEVNIGTENQIAKFHNEGTKPYEIRPKREGGRLFFMTASGPVFAKKVNHPGLPRRRMIPSDALAERIALETVQLTIKKMIDKANKGKA